MNKTQPDKLLKHFVVSGYIVFMGRVLLVAHRKLNKWLPPGGHIEECETPEDALLREISEETGVNITIMTERDIRGDDNSVISLCMPSHIQVEDIDDSHQHIDLVYFCKATDNNIWLEETKLAKAHWFLPEDLNAKADVEYQEITLPKHVSLLSLRAIEAANSSETKSMN
jgi:8-oxo-dGTP pyrophosphatase MutT (NUDIX family)